MDFKNMTDKEIDDYIISKLNFKESEIISPLILKYDKFVQPNSACMANIAKAHAFRMDCYDLYRDFLKFYRDNKFGTIIYDQITAVNIFQNKYFGLIGNDQERIKLNLSLPDLHSIKAYKGCAMCFERSMLTQNLFKLLEIESSLITKNYHTYNLLNSGKSMILYDATNPTIAKLKGTLTLLPTIKIISNREQEGYLYGDKDITISPSFYEMMYGATEVKVPKLVYKGLSLPQIADEKGIE